MNDKTRQLGLEIQLLLLHLVIPAQPQKQEVIEQQSKELVSLASQLDKLEPDAALSMLNDLLSLMKWPYQVKFFDDKTAKEYVMNNPAVFHLVGRIMSFLACPLLAEINVEDIKKQRDNILKIVNGKTMNLHQGLDVMEMVRIATLEIGQIIDKYEHLAGHRSDKPEDKPITKSKK